VFHSWFIKINVSLDSFHRTVTYNVIWFKSVCDQLRHWFIQTREHRHLFNYISCICCTRYLQKKSIAEIQWNDCLHNKAV